jgi:transcriptional regulator with XRE-family HTH domain
MVFSFVDVASSLRDRARINHGLPIRGWRIRPPASPLRDGRIVGPWLWSGARGRNEASFQKAGFVIDRTAMADFLRRRREALQPEDVGLPRGARRRTSGLRREEVAVLAHMSTDYYARLERERGPQPSEQMIAAIAQGLHLSLDERDHLFRLAGHTPPTRGAVSDHISPGMLRTLDRLTDTPAEIVTELGETLRQSPLSVALTGDTTRFTGAARSMGYRWFTDPDERRIHPEDEHAMYSRLYASGLRGIVALRGPGSRAARLVDLLMGQNEEFRMLWNEHEVGVRPAEVKRFVHPEVGVLELNCQSLLDPDQSHRLMVYTAVPGSDSYEKLQLLSVIGAQTLR